MQPKLLILDLDETLVFSTKEPLSGPEDFRVGKYFVYKRPGLDDFLRFAEQHFKLAVWTAAGATYASEVLVCIFPDVERLEFAWTGERCTRRFDPETGTAYNIKDLKKVHKRGYSLKSVLMVDDTASKLERHYGNHIGILPFEGDLEDRELGKLANYLLRLKDVENVRTVDKRYWRSTTAAPR